MAQLFNNLYLLTICIFSVFTFLYLWIGRNKGMLNIQISGIFSFFISIILVILIGYYPISDYSDKFFYRISFQSFSSDDFESAKDIGWTIYVRISRFFLTDPDLFFMQTASVYLLGYIIFIKRSVEKEYRIILFIATISSFGFLGYGVNTIRSGLALSILLLAYSYRRKLYLAVFLGFFAVLMHKSVVIIILAFLLSRFFKNVKTLYRLWFVFLILSIINIPGIESLLFNLIGTGTTNRFESYLNTTDATTHYKTGFKLNFVVYSALPIFVGYYYIVKKSFTDKLYLQMFSVYIIVNSLWLLLIRIPYTDRVAYLSWFLIPFILLYPILKSNLMKNQRGIIAIILIGICSFTFLMTYK